ncbi:hypothetical protein Dsin_010515 [Dipteronia sinensis]|uniref:Cytochrome P450 n=1 Tax=Dipteronia sinensis TaxID=43782 RepID=A0AAE0ATC8_9ROSI|nr:hypothetical protein Dsin_010515 [Dipteronia sinensis]
MAFQNLPIWLLLLLAPLLLLLLLKRMKQIKALNNQLPNPPPSPPKLPILGNLHQIGALPHQSYKQISEKHGPVMLLKFGVVPVIVFSSAAAAREVFKIHGLNSCTRPRLTGWIIDRLSGYHSKLERVFLELDTFFEQVIGDHAKAEKSKEEDEDIIDVLLKIQRNQTEFCESWMKNDHIKATLLLPSENLNEYLPLLIPADGSVVKGTPTCQVAALRQARRSGFCEARTCPVQTKHDAENSVNFPYKNINFKQT